VWVREEREGAETPAPRSRVPLAELPGDLLAAVRNAAWRLTVRGRERIVTQLQAAVEAYNRGRYEEAARRISPVAETAPLVPGVREVAGLANYRAQRFRPACAHLRAHFDLTKKVDNLPALMDAERALGHSRAVAKYFEEVRAASPPPEVLSEARIVMASSLADRGDLDAAVQLLVEAGAEKSVRNPADRHIRQWYVLGDLLERTGDVPRARQLFARVAVADPSAYDVDERLDELGGRASRPRRRR
jgi:tetratricopeptide (TPR) repeat protein